jgi:hypothetical protein
MSSNEKKMKKQCKVFSITKKMQISAEGEAHMGTRVDLAALFGLSVLTLSKIVSNEGS